MSAVTKRPLVFGLCCAGVGLLFGAFNRTVGESGVALGWLFARGSAR